MHWKTRNLVKLTMVGIWVAMVSAGPWAATTPQRPWRTGQCGSEALVGLSFSGGRFVTWDASGKSYLSQDGQAWTETVLVQNQKAAAMPASVPSEESSVRAFAKGEIARMDMFMAVGRSGALWASQDGENWWRAAVPEPQMLYGVVWAGDGFVSVGADGCVFSSRDGFEWEKEPSSVTSDLYAVAYGNGQIVAVGAHGAVIVARAPAPTVTGVSPNAGPLAGGTTVVITGTGFAGTPAVNFGANPATAIVLNSATQITCKSPAGLAGMVHVTVDGSATSSADQFTYYALPTVTAITPNAGLTSGGTTVTITGTNFAPGTGATTVKFGTVAATSVAYGSPTTLTAVSPAQAAGMVDIIVTAPGGTSAAVAADKFTYVAAQPVVLSLSPASGPMAGGTTVTLAGVGFTGATSVKFGTIAGTSVTVSSDTALTVVSPAKVTSGAVDVTVTTAGGTSPTWSGDLFTYLSPSPTVTALSPTSGPTAGGTTVTITGTNFLSGATVKFGAMAATSVTFVSTTKMTAVSPAGTGIVDVTVTTSVGTSAITANDKFTFVMPPAVTAISPNVGSNLGGTSIIVTGTAFQSGASLKVGGVAATDLTITATTVQAKTGPHASGVVDVVVTNLDGQSSTLAGAFTYADPPAIQSVTKVSEPFRLKVLGNYFQPGCTIKINGMAVPETTFFSGSKLIAKKGDVLKAMVPVKGVTYQITVTNPGGVESAPYPYIR